MRYILIIIFLAVVITLGYGFMVKSENLEMGEFCIGISMIGLFFVWMPIFIFHRWRNKSAKDYMLTKENIEKMRQEGKDKNL